MKFVIGSGSARKIEVTEKIIREFFDDNNIEVLGYPATTVKYQTN
jgi:hypothetical protein